jgi:LDH2 family malate/lactate/ureidoglycolate dehydrogenase
MSSDRVHLNVGEARALGERALRGIGYDAEDARIVCDHVIDAALCGYEYSGLAKILNIPENRRFAQPRHPMRLVHETEVSALYDGGNNNGMIAMYHGATAAIEKAAAHGISIVSVSNTWMSGRSAYFVEMIARAGLVAIHTASSGPVVAPYGGTKGALGTNPIAFALPGEDGPLVLDIGTSAFMATELQLRARLGQTVPEGIGLDRDGNPTTEASAIRDGGVLLPFGGPSGGYKGFGLALIVQAFGLLAGGAQEGYVFIAFRPDLLVPLADLKREIAALIARIKAVPRQEGFSEIRIPGEQSARNRERLQREGLTIDRLVYDRLQALAGLNAPRTAPATAGR